MDALAASRLWTQMPTQQRQVALLSGGGHGAGGMWAMTGLGERRMLQNAHFREALRLRLCQISAPIGAICQLPRDAVHDQEGTVCGERMDHSSCILVHPLLCDHAAAHLRPHRALCRAIGRACRATGAAVDYERHVPHMYVWGRPTNATGRLSLMWWWRGLSQPCYAQ